MTFKRPSNAPTAEDAPSAYAKAREEAKKKALRALRRAQQVAIRNQVDLSEWEGEFLSTVTARIETYGRAFADPDKGAMEAPLSLMQGLKLREITKKARRDKKIRPDSGDDKGSCEDPGTSKDPAARDQALDPQGDGQDPAPPTLRAPKRQSAWPNRQKARSRRLQQPPKS